MCFNHGNVNGGLTAAKPIVVDGRFSAIGTSGNLCCLGHENGKLELYEITKNDIWKLVDSKSNLHLKALANFIFIIKKIFFYSCFPENSLELNIC